MIRKVAFYLILGLFFNDAKAQIKTDVSVNLSVVKDSTVEVTVFNPTITSNIAEYVIPEIIPGTYMKVNFVRFYSNFRAYNKDGKFLKVKLKKNILYIYDAKELNKLIFSVRQSRGDKKIWDNELGCGGTVFQKDNAYLINFQLVTGYFRGFEKYPFEVSITKPESLFGTTALTQVNSTGTVVKYKANTYAELIDKPILFAKPDSSSFIVNGTKFEVAAYSESNKIYSKYIAKRLETMMIKLHDFCNGFVVKDYRFMFYFVDTKKHPGFFSNFGLGSALEHLNSSVYFLEDQDTTNIDWYIYWVCSHEFLHTMTPITIHSEKIENFNFEHSEMSQHIWFYEGFTDYMSNYFTESSGLKDNSFQYDLASAISYAEHRKKRSLTWSSTNIIKRNNLQVIPKFLQMGNFYMRGKLVAFCMDMELNRISKGTYRLRDLMLKLKDQYSMKSFFADSSFIDVLVKISYPEMRPFLEKYVVGKELPPYTQYLNEFGWQFIAKGTKVPAYCKKIKYEVKKVDEKYYNYYIKSISKNSLGLKKNDTLIYAKGYDFVYNLYNPKKLNDSITLKVKRGTEILILHGVANRRAKNRFAAIKSDEMTLGNIEFYKLFFRKEK